MAKIFALLGVVLILSGILLLAVPRDDTTAQRTAGPSVGVQVKQAPTLLTQMRAVAEQANAPLSILFGVLSLYYTRRTYLNSQRNRQG